MKRYNVMYRVKCGELDEPLYPGKIIRVEAIDSIDLVAEPIIVTIDSAIADEQAEKIRDIKL